MKIRFIIHDINKNGGQERSTLEIVNSLSRKKHEIEVYASTASDLDPSVQYIRVATVLRKPLLVKDFFFRLFASMKISNSAGFLAHATGTSVFFADAFTIQFIQKRWMREIHKVRYISSLKALKERLQVLHDWLWEELVIRLNKNSRYFAISDQVSNDLKSLYGLKDVVIIPHGINQSEFFPNFDQARAEIIQHHPEVKNRKIILFVGAFERKGLRTVLEALSQDPLKSAEWVLLVIGAGPISSMTELARKLGISSKVIFTGSKKNVATYFQASDLFVLPSHYDPFGLVGAEALACGCPSILSASSGCSSLIQRGANGYVLQDSSDSVELAGHIETFFKNADGHRQMRIQAHQSTLQFNWSRISESYEASFLQMQKAEK